MLTKVKEWIDARNLLVEGDRVLVACSGGPDSLALLYVLCHLQSDYHFYLAAAHVDHMFRGRESAEDAAFVRKTCTQLGIKCYQTAINVPEYIKKTGRSTEDAARILRYAFLRQTARSEGLNKIATGHNRDDQAETVLLNLLRGAGGAGLAGMQAVTKDIIRPLLNTTRQEIEEYCKVNHLKPRFDSTNAHTDYTRNRIRLELLPILQEYNANIKDALYRTAMLVGDEHDFIRQYVLKLTHSGVVFERDGITTFDCKRLQQEHPAVQRELLRTIIEKKRGDLKGITFWHVEQLVKMLLHRTVGSKLVLPGGLVAKKGYGTLELGSAVFTASSSVTIPNPGIAIAIPGTTTIPELGIRVIAKVWETKPFNVDSCSAVFDLDTLQLPVYVRTRLAGDRFCPCGMQGHKKLKDFFIDVKILQEKRDNVPIFTDKLDIIWVGRYRRAQHGKVSTSTKQFLQLTIIEQGDI